MKKLIASFGAVILALGIVVFGASLTASAHNKAANITCTMASVSLTSYDQGATALIYVDGTMVYGHHGTTDGGSTFGGTYVQSWPLTSDANHTSHRLQVTVISTDGAQYNLNYDQSVTGCYTPPPPTVSTPIAPTANAGIETCVDGKSVDANGTIHLPSFVGGHFAEHAAGDIPNVAPGEYAFTPVADDGYVLSSDEPVFVTVPASVDVDCAPVLIDVAIVPPTSTPATCDAAATYTLYAQPTGIKYVLIDGVRPVAGTYTLADGESITIQAHSIAGYTPVSGTWTFTGQDKLATQSTDANAPCYVAPPVVTPPTDTPVPPTMPTITHKELATTGTSDPTVPLLAG